MEDFVNKPDSYELGDLLAYNSSAFIGESSKWMFGWLGVLKDVSLCSASTLVTPDMSEGYQAKMS
jgi:hypothetical protein